MVERITKSDARDDVVERGWQGPGWYFWDECGVLCYGPYASRDEAGAAEAEYARNLDRERRDV